MDERTPPEWQGTPWALAPDKFWSDDTTGELVCAATGARMPAAAREAFDACYQLVLAYAKGKANGGSVDWSDVDEAWSAARYALETAGVPLPEALDDDGCAALA